MKKNWRRVMAALLGVMMCLTLTMTTVMAEEAEEGYPKVGIPVTIELTGDRPITEDTFEVTLTAKNGAPMPEGSVNGEYTLEIEGEDTVSFPEIVYTRVGVYEYTIRQKSGDNKYVDYDETVYEVTVYITNKEGGGYDVTVVAYEKGGDDKCEVIFENRYDYPNIPVIPPPETEPEETKPERPEPPETNPPETDPVETEPPETEPEVIEPEETEPEETEPEPEIEPEVIEPEPEKPEEILLQTGQLNWPIPVFGGLGVIVLCVGILLLRKKKKNDHA